MVYPFAGAADGADQDKSAEVVRMLEDVNALGIKHVGGAVTAKV
jgi:uncharacterized protein with von Willebrand factor type A (vWA) domain